MALSWTTSVTVRVRKPGHEGGGATATAAGAAAPASLASMLEKDARQPGLSVSDLLGLLAITKQSLGRVLTELQARVTASPRDIKARWALADFFQKIGRVDKASEQLAEIVRIEPGNIAAWDALGNTQLALQRPAEAEKLYRDALKKWPKASPAWRGLATALFHQHRYLEACGAGDPRLETLARQAAAVLERVEARGEQMEKIFSEAD